MSVLAPPPTTNILDHDQRIRLLRSTRKLGDVLGTTPFLLEPVDDSPPLLPPKPAQASPVSKPAAPDSLNVVDVGTRKLAPRPLILRLNPVHVPPGDVRLHPGDNPISPTSPALRRRAYTLPSPITPTPEEPRPEVSRRKKMAKLARTLGENVPPELVFPGDFPAFTYASSASSSSSASLSSADSLHSSSSSALSIEAPSRHPFAFTSARTSKSKFKTTPPSLPFHSKSKITKHRPSPSTPVFSTTSTLTGTEVSVGARRSRSGSQATVRPRSGSLLSQATVKGQRSRTGSVISPASQVPAGGLRSRTGSVISTSQVPVGGLRSRTASILNPTYYSPPPPVSLTTTHQYHYLRHRESAAPFSDVAHINNSSAKNTDTDTDSSGWLKISVDGRLERKKKREKSKEWSGKWNLRDISEVQKGLRALK